MSAMKQKMRGSLDLSIGKSNDIPNYQSRPVELSKFKLQACDVDTLEEQKEIQNVIIRSPTKENDPFHSKYEEQETLGEGGAAVVKKCRHRDTGKEYAVKMMRNYDAEKEMNSKKEFELVNEFPHHPNIIKMQEFIATENWTYTVMELAEGKELQIFAKEMLPLK